MNDFERPHTTRGSCLCAQCYLVACGAVDPSWDGWSWVWLSGEGRVAMMLLTGQPPVHFTYPRQDWMGAIPWFDRAGVGLQFDADDEDDDDEPVA
jgi:hypothetical protein